VVILLQKEIIPYYRKCSEEFNKIYEYLKQQYTSGYVDEVCKLRGYVGKEQRSEIERLQLGSCMVLPSMLGDMSRELGLVSKGGTFLLDNRYIIPVEDISYNIVALIGYYPDTKKYITTPSPFFSKEGMFFNFRRAYDLAWKEFGGRVFLVEGIFDCISMQSIGLPCIATMGASVGSVKGELLKLFSKVVGIPDNDKTGRRSLNRYDKRYGWNVPYNTTLIRLQGVCDFGDGEVHKVKDCDNLVSWYDAEDVREMLTWFFDSKEDIEDLHI
jgi:hypothetical protein